MDDEVFEKYRLAGKVTARARDYGAELIREGVLALEVANKVEEFIVKQGAGIAFPVNLAINSQAAHYTPAIEDELKFQKGDIVKLDVGAHVDGYIGDSAITVEVGTRNWTDLIRASREALDVAVEMMRGGMELTKIGENVETTIQQYSFRPVRNLTGHLLERYNLHAGKSVPNVKSEDEDSKHVTKAGEVYAIEPFASTGEGYVTGSENGNIYRFLRKRMIANLTHHRFLSLIERNFSTLPFAARWCAPLISEAGIDTSFPPEVKDQKGGRRKRHEEMERREKNTGRENTLIQQKDAEKGTAADSPAGNNPDISRSVVASLSSLLRIGAIMTYPILVDVADGMVSQAEHTVFVTEEGCEVLTR